MSEGSRQKPSGMEVERLAATAEVCVRMTDGAAVRLDEAVPGITVDGVRAMLQVPTDGAGAEVHVCCPRRASS